VRLAGAPVAAIGNGNKFGNGDVVLAPTLEGAIRPLTVKGAQIGTADTADEHFGIVARKAIGILNVGTTAYKATWQGIANLVIKENIV
jgi:hypothetical protein